MPPHCSKESMEWLSTRFQDRIISRNAEFLWPPYSPDLNPCDFYLWGYLKSKVYTNPTPKTTEELKKTSEGKRERSNLIQSSRLQTIVLHVINMSQLIKDDGLNKLLIIKYFYCIIIIFIYFHYLKIQKLSGNFICQKDQSHLQSTHYFQLTLQG